MATTIKDTLDFYVTIHDPVTDFVVISAELPPERLDSVWNLLSEDRTRAFSIQNNRDSQVFIPPVIFNRSVRYVTLITPEVRGRIDAEEKRRERSRYI